MPLLRLPCSTIFLPIYWQHQTQQTRRRKGNFCHLQKSAFPLTLFIKGLMQTHDLQTFFSDVTHIYNTFFYGQDYE